MNLYFNIMNVKLCLLNQKIENWDIVLLCLEIGAISTALGPEMWAITAIEPEKTIILP